MYKKLQEYLDENRIKSEIDENLLTKEILLRFSNSSFWSNGKKLYDIDINNNEFEGMDTSDHGSAPVLAHYFIPYANIHYFVIGAELIDKYGWIFNTYRIENGSKIWMIVSLTELIEEALTPVYPGNTYAGMILEKTTVKRLEIYLSMYEQLLI